jgi:surface protein
MKITATKNLIIILVVILISITVENLFGGKGLLSSLIPDTYSLMNSGSLMVSDKEGHNLVSTSEMKKRSEDKFFLHENGVTCLCPSASPGEKGFLDGVEFEAVDNALIRQRRDEGADMTKLCTSLVTDMVALFENRNFNQLIGNWDVGNVTNMSKMFQNSFFNQPIESWNVGNVTNMSRMFQNSAFNQPIESWNVGNVISMEGMFQLSSFNQPIGNWDVSSVTSVASMFYENMEFNRPLENWDVSNVVDMSWMFTLSTFNQPIGNWNVGNVNDMNHMFHVSQFNQPIGNWDVSSVTNMASMFQENMEFNQPIGNWDVSSVTDMASMFAATIFNQNISTWCVTNFFREPSNFSYFNDLVDENKPKWGTCGGKLTIEVIANQSYTGADLTPAVVVKDGNTTLTPGTDYNVAYTDNTNVGIATVTVTGAGNYTGTATQTFTILAKDASTLTIEPFANETYTGADFTPAVVVKDGNTTLTLVTDYNVVYTDNRNAGTATVTVTGAGNYTGTKTQTFTIVAKDASTLTIDDIANQTYAGVALTPAVVVKDGNTTLTLDTDYAVAYTDNTSVGTATATITGIGNYTGAKTETFTIVAKDASTLTIEAIANQIYTGADLTPIVVVKDGNTTLTLDTDYTVAYSDNTSVGTATVTITGSGNYTGTTTQTFSILKLVSSTTIDPIANETYTGADLTPAIVVKDGNTTLTLDTDYTVAYTDNTNVGTATVTVTGAGNYTGTTTQTFTIVAKDASTLTIDAIANQTYAGVALTPAVVVKDGNTTLTLDTDYAVAYTDNTSVGTATATITGIGNYTGAKTETFTIVAKDASTLTIEAIANETYTGTDLTPAVVVKDGNTNLTLDTDYTVAYLDNTNVGTATATITGIGNYTGTKTQTFTIVAKDASTLTIDAIADETYTGTDLTPAVVVKDGNTTLTLDTDYTVAYSDNTNVGTATVTVTGAGNYTGTTTQTFTIVAKDASTLTIDAIANQTYAGVALTPAVVVKDGNTTLTLDTDYAVAYTDNTSVGTATATITGIGNYTGAKTETFTIVAKDASTLTIDAIADETYTGTDLTPAVVVKDGNTNLTLDTDYTVAYLDNTNVGTATATITGIGNYTGTKTQTFTIVAKDASTLTIDAIADETYTGTDLTPAVVVKDGNTTLTLDTDYTVAYSDNTNVGTATVTITGIGNYTGAKTQTFTIVSPISTASISSTDSEVGEGESIVISASIDAISTEEVLIYPSFSGSAVLGIDYTVAFESKGLELVAGGNGQGNNANQLNGPAPIVTFISEAEQAIYIADASSGRVIKWGFGAQTGEILINNPDVQTITDIYVDKNKNIYLVEQNASVVSRWIYPNYSQRQVLAGRLRENGSAANLLHMPYSFQVIENDSQIEIFVSDAENHRVQKWVVGQNQGTTVAGGNGSGSTANQLFDPRKIWVDEESNVFVLDSRNSRIQKWAKNATQGETVYQGNQFSVINDFDRDREGNWYLINRWPSISLTKYSPDFKKQYLLMDGSMNSAYEFDNPTSIRVDAFGDAYIGDAGNFWVVKYNNTPKFKIPAGQTTANITITAIDNDQFDGERSIDIAIESGRNIDFDPSQNVLISIKENDTPDPLVSLSTSKQEVGEGDSFDLTASLNQVSSRDAFINLSFGGAADLDVDFTADFPTKGPRIVAGGNGSGSQLNQLGNPLAITMGPDGAIYTADENSQLAKWMPGKTEKEILPYTANRVRDLHVDKDNNVFVLDEGSNRLIKFTPGSNIGVTVAGSPNQTRGSSSSRFDTPVSLFIDDLGAMYIADHANHRIQKWEPGSTQGITVAGGNGEGSGSNQLRWPRAVTVGKDGAIYVSDANWQITKWIPGKADKEVLPISTGGAWDIHIDENDNLYILEEWSHTLVKYAKNSLDRIIIAGNSDNSTGSSLNMLNNATSFYVDESKNILIADKQNHRIVKYQFAPEIVIPKGQLSGGIVVKTLKDGRYEDDELIQISVANGINIDFDSDQSTSVLILDNDEAPEVTFELSADRITEGAQDALEIVARTKALSGKDIEILLSISEKSDAPSEKYEISDLNMRILAGDSTARVLVSAAKYDDDTVDPLSKIILNIESINNAFTAQEEITILFEDDDFPQVTLTASPESIEEGGNFDLTATLNAVSSRDAVIALSFAGKAEFDSDYTVDFPTKGPSVVAGGNGEGDDLNQTRRPRAVALGKDGSIYVSDENWELTRWYPGKAEKERLYINTNGGRAVHVDENDNIYVLEEWGHKLVKYIAGSTSVTFIAGDPNGQSGDGANRLNNPQGFFIAENGDIYIADQHNHRIQKWAKGATEGVTVAGGNGDGRASDQLSWPLAVTVDSKGMIYVSDNSGQITRWTPGKSERENLQIPTNGARGLYVDKADNLYVLEEWGNKLVKYALGTTAGVVIAGDANGQSGNRIDRFNGPQGLAFDAMGNVFIADLGNNRVVKYQFSPEIIIPKGQMSSSITVKTIDDNSFEEDENIEFSITNGANIVFDRSIKQSVIVKDNDQAPEITFTLSSDRLIEGSSGSVIINAKPSVIAGKDIKVFLSISKESDVSPDKYEISSLEILIPAGESLGTVSLSAAKYNDEIVDVLRNLVLSVDSVSNAFTRTEKINILYESDDDPSFTLSSNVSEIAEHLSFEVTATLSAPSSREAKIALATSGTATFDQDYTIDFPTKGTKVILGNNSNDSDSVLLNRPRAFAIAKDGTYYISDESWQLLKWNPSSTKIDRLPIHTAGALALHVDDNDNVYVLEEWSNRLVKYVPGSFEPTVIAGNINSESGPGLSRLHNPSGLYFAENGDIYIADQNNHRVVKWSKGATSGIVVAGGNGEGDGSNQLRRPRAVTVGAGGVIYVSDDNWQITKWIPGNPAKEILPIQSNGARGIHIDKANNLYVLEEWGNRLVRYTEGSFQRQIIVGSENTQSGNNLNQLSGPMGLRVDALGNIYIADRGNNRIIKYQLSPEIIIPAGQTKGSIQVNLVDDDINEPNETILVNSTSSINSFSIDQNPLSVTILDNSKTLALKDNPFVGLSNGAVAWGDYDRDGDMDVVVIGTSPVLGVVTRLYKNDKGKFVDTNQNFARFFNGDVSWVDINKDGWIDIVISGLSNQKADTKVYLNVEGRYFEESSAYNLPKMFSSKMAWGDLDNDGDIDLAIAGIDENDKYRFQVYYKVDGEERYVLEPDFTTTYFGTDEFGFTKGDLKIIDVDLDGDNDIVFTGESKEGNPVGALITNSLIRTGQFNFNGWFENSLRFNLKNSSIAVGKISSTYNSQLDIVTMGEDDSKNIRLTSFNAKLIAQSAENPDSFVYSSLKNGALALGDLNNDGLLDLVQSGEDDKGNPVTKILLQRQNNFEEWKIDLIGLRESTINLVDYDMDGDLDLFLTGLDKNGLPRAILYESQIKNKVNLPPAKVNGLKLDDLGNGRVRFSWNPASDDHSKNLGYNLRLGTSPGGTELSNVSSDLETGYRLISVPATIYGTTFETQLDPGIYYWSVQAVDDGLFGGEFSNESNFTLVYEWKILNQGGIVDRTIIGLVSPVVKLGDLNGNGKLDLIYGSGSSGYSTNVYKYDGKRLIRDHHNPFYAERLVGAEVGDINGDGVLDVLINNFTFDNRFNFTLYLSNTNGYYETYSDESLFKAKGKIVDLNNDGIAEVLISGFTNSTAAGRPELIVYEYQGQGTSFKKYNLSSQVAPLLFSSFDMGDFDNDQDIDYVLTGFSTDGLRSYLYENITELGGELKLKQTSNNLVAVRDGTIDFIDFDGDGDLDIIVTGTGASGDVFEVYMNQLREGKSTWPRIDLGLTPIRGGKIDLGDFNGDGYADILYSGVVQGQGKVTKLAEFDPVNLKFVDSDFDVSDITDAEVEFGDIDGDGDLDFVISGTSKDNTSQHLFKTYLNVRSESAKVLNAQSSLQAMNHLKLMEDDLINYRLTDVPFNDLTSFEAPDLEFVENNAPSIPTVNPTKILTDLKLPNNKFAVEFSWSPSVDDFTPSSGLTYALRIGTTPNGEEILSSNANSDGGRKVPGKGNVEHNLKWKLSLSPGTYYWSVQSIDASFAGSSFSKEEVFTINEEGINMAPKILSNEFYVREFSVIDTKIGTLDYEDAENHKVYFEIKGGNENNFFRLDSLSGEIFVKNNSDLSYSSYPSIQLSIGVKDELGAESVTTVTIYLLEDFDSDNDGVKDYLDKCPNTPTGMQVDENGCAVLQDVIELNVKPIVVKLGSDGTALIKAEDIDNGTKHPYLELSLSLSKVNFSCADLGQNKVTFKAKTSTGKESTQEVTITVVDDIKPTVKVKSGVTVKLDAQGKAILKVDDIDGGSTDNCGIFERKISQTTFDCLNVGSNKIVFTAKDGSGNESTQEVTITVVEDIKPTVKVKSGVTVKLDAQGKATLKVEDIDGGSTDNCGITERKLSKATFDCSNVGTNKIIFTAKDGSGNESTQEVTITVVDDIKPAVKVKPGFTVKLDAQGKATLKVEDIDGGSTDNCGIIERKLSKATFDCSNLGSSKIVFTAKDGSGNESTQEVTITVVDDIKPTVKVKSDVTVKLDAQGKATLKVEDIDDASTDNCGITDRKLSKATFDCSNVGTNKIIFTAKDGSGNESTQEVTITVVDDIKPTVKVKSGVTVKLDAEGKATLKWEDIDDGSTDNCGITERTLSKAEFNKNDAGDQKITYTVKDSSGNTTTAEVTVKVDVVMSIPNFKVEEKASIKLYPNPAKNSVVVEFEKIVDPELSTIEIIDVTGRVISNVEIIERTERSIRINTNELSSGVYFLRLSSLKSLHVLKFIIEK